MRNRSLCFSAIVAILALGLHAEARAGAWEAGVKTGLNLASFRGDYADLVGTKTKLGFVGGGYAAYRLGPAVALQAELLYSMKGAKVTSTWIDFTGNPTGTIKGFWVLDYLEVPLLARVSFAQGSMVRPELIAGPALGFKLRARFEPGAPGTGTRDLDNVRAVDVGAALGAGASIGRGPLRLLLEARYTTGFSDLYDLSGNLESINQAFSFMVGVSR